MSKSNAARSTVTGRSFAVAHFVRRTRSELEVNWPSANEPALLVGSGREPSDALSTAHSPRRLSPGRINERQRIDVRDAGARIDGQLGLDSVDRSDRLMGRRGSSPMISHLGRSNQNVDSWSRNDGERYDDRDVLRDAKYALHRSETSMTDATTRTVDYSTSIILVIDIGGTHIKFGYVVEGRPRPFTHLVSTQRLRGANPVERLASEAKQAIGLHGVLPDIVVCTVPGFLARDGDRVLHLPNLPEMDGHCLKTDLAMRLGLPVVLERDSNLALLGESLAGAAKDASTVLGIFFGTGIGASLIIDGSPFRGSGWALELGHAPFFGEFTEDTTLKHPSIEDYASGRALQGIASRHGTPIGEVFKNGDSDLPLGLELDRFVRYQALAVSSAVAALSPETIVLGGGVLDIAGYPKGRLQELIAANAPWAKTGVPMDLRWATLGWGSVLHGAPRIVHEYTASQLLG